MRNSAIIAMTAFLLAGTAAHAGTFKYKEHIDNSILTTVKISDDSGATYLTVKAGQIPIERTGGTDPIQTPLGIFYTFCVETTQYLKSNTSMVLPLEFGNNSSGPLGVTRANAIRQLFARFDPNLYAPLATDVAAALQLAIWEVADETTHSYSLTGGSFEVMGPSSILTLGQSYLDALTSNGPKVINLFAAVNNDYQDLLLQGGPTGIVVPEPAMAMLFGLGFAGMFAARRRASR